MAANSQAKAGKAPASKKSAARKKPVAKKKSAAGKKTAAAKKPTARKKAAPVRKAGGKEAWEKKPKQTSELPEQPIMAALRAEHKHLATIMGLFENQLASIEEGKLVDTHVVYEIMDYMRSWPDRYHHPREDLIYGRAAELNPVLADNVDSLQREHDAMAKRGQAVLQNIESWRQGGGSGERVIESGRDYIERTYKHMNSEEKLVFPAIEKTLSLADWRELAAEDLLAPVSDPVFGGRVDREFRNLARKLRRGIRRRVERGVVVEWIDIDAVMEGLEVVSMALESARGSAGEHLQAAMDDSADFVRAAPVSGIFRSVANNSSLTRSLLRDVISISRDTLTDLSRVNQERKDRIRLLGRDQG
ncbi:MAG: hemerythrin domain-containing protein [Thiogranum sp.]